MSPLQMAEYLRELSTMVPEGWHEVCETSAAYIERQTKLLALLEIELVERDKKIIRAECPRCAAFVASRAKTHK